jgi:hypothetical protein
MTRPRIVSLCDTEEPDQKKNSIRNLHIQDYQDLHIFIYNTAAALIVTSLENCRSEKRGRRNITNAAMVGRLTRTGYCTNKEKEKMKKCSEGITDDTRFRLCCSCPIHEKQRKCNADKKRNLRLKQTYGQLGRNRLGCIL